MGQILNYLKMYKKHKNNTNAYHNLCIKQDYHGDVIIKQIDSNRILSLKEKKEIFDKCTRRRKVYHRLKNNSIGLWFIHN